MSQHFINEVSSTKYCCIDFVSCHSILYTVCVNDGLGVTLVERSEGCCNIKMLLSVEGIKLLSKWHDNLPFRLLDIMCSEHTVCPAVGTIEERSLGH